MATNSNTYSVPAALIEARACLADAKSELTWAIQRGLPTGEARTDARHWERVVAMLERAAVGGIHMAKRR